MAHRSQLSCLNQGGTLAYHSHSLTPSSNTPVNKMTAPQRTSSQDSATEGIRKRVCKACDRCRLKKSKCDGSNPCSRCKTDNAICVFGERKKSQDKVYPKGYVEQLERQQTQLVSGLVILYEKLEKAGAWEGPQLDMNADGKPYTHYILQALDLLETSQDGTVDEFEEDTEKLQQKLIDMGAGMTQHPRRGSFSSDSELSQRSHARTHSHGTPMMAQDVPAFKTDFKFEAKSEPSSPPTHSNVAPRSHRHSFQQLSAQSSQPSPLQHSSPPGEDVMFQPGWTQYAADDPKFALQPGVPSFAIQAPSVQQHMGMPTFQTWDPSGYTPDMGDFDQQFWTEASMQNPYNNGTLENMDFEYNGYVSVQT